LTYAAFLSSDAVIGKEPRVSTRKNLIGWRLKSSDESIASVRIRCLNPLGELRRRGFPVELYDDRRAHRYAAVVYTKAYDDGCLREAEALTHAGATIVLDLCDNHFFHDGADARLDRKTGRLRRMLALSDRVITSTAELARVVREETHGDKIVRVVEDAVEPSLRAPLLPIGPRLRALRRLKRLRRSLRIARAEGRTPLVWFGVHGGPYARCGIADLERIKSLLHDLDRQSKLSLTVLSNSRQRFQEVTKGWSIPCFYADWHPATFFRAMREHAISVIPISPSPFTRCKSHNRPAQALHLGLAVVADAIPSYERLRPVIRLNDWEGGLSTYLRDPIARARDAALGQELVGREFSLAKIADEWQSLFHGLLERYEVLEVASEARAAVA
jgi:hypothetical protein